MPREILLIDDDAPFRKTLRKVLEFNGFSAREAPTGKAGIAETLRARPDLVVLDLVMPGMRGLEVCQALKQRVETASVPILILTGSDQDGQDIACLDMGADDYLTKPVRTERLLAHCQALLRRFSPPATALLELGALSLDHARKLVRVGREEYAHLTPKEFDLLYHLAARSPEPSDREALYRAVWGMEPPSEGSLKTVEVHVRRVRLKLGWRSDRWLVTVTGRGYALKPPA